MRLILFAFILLIDKSIVAQEFNFGHHKNVAELDTATWRESLEKREKLNDDDPELAADWLGYYFSISKHVTDSDTLDVYTEKYGFSYTENDRRGSWIYLHPRYKITWYDSIILDKGFQKIISAIQDSPNRLDLRFLYADVLGEIKDYSTQTQVVLEMMDHSEKINHKWWKEHNTKIQEAKSYLLDRILGYEVQLFEQEEEALLDEMLQIAQKMVEIEPDFQPGWLSLSLAEIGKKNYDEAIKALGKALKINAKDIVALNNMAYCYSMKGDNENAIHYYEEVIRYGDKNDQFLAREEIMYLKK